MQCTQQHTVAIYSAVPTCVPVNHYDGNISTIIMEHQKDEQ